ncbi:MAG TPA: agmatine deiminase family protein [Candidatus Acidoferrales bacterium]|nr:agmatine deiminase family protein [Candidatus Acidoferrales bacterium]
MPIQNLNIYPSQLAYRLPAEWEKHEATWLGWPHNKSDWPGKFAPVPWVYAEIVKRISRGEKARVIVECKDHEKQALDVLRSANVDLTNVEIFTFKTNRGWTRDSGPLFVKNEDGIAQVNFKFNGWAKYHDYKKDQKLSGFISKKFGLTNFIPEYDGAHVVLEGGAIDTNGLGTLVTTEECLLNEKVQARNPGFTKTDYEEVFKNYLGIVNVLWLGKGIAGDDTHGHVDDLCRFVNANTLLLVREENTSDDNFGDLQENKERLQDFKLEDGSKPEIIFLPMPDPVIFKGQRLPASYANFYISNAAVLVPTFDDPHDKEALGIIGELISDRPVIGIHALDLAWGLGTLHCLTHEHPAV